mmetsp:Transcript_3660/g.5317  ORF Transcript_3660/g.5317 Transcript_3660/m.5317 type:complete len:215 (+) Transcript_3660:369-1013(+)
MLTQNLSEFSGIVPHTTTLFPASPLSPSFAVPRFRFRSSSMRGSLFSRECQSESIIKPLSSYFVPKSSEPLPFSARGTAGELETEVTPGSTLELVSLAASAPSVENPVKRGRFFNRFLSRSSYMPPRLFFSSNAARALAAASICCALAPPTFNTTRFVRVYFSNNFISCSVKSARLRYCSGNLESVCNDTLRTFGTSFSLSSSESLTSIPSSSA